MIKDRAEDRATLKHSSTGSKWSKDVKRLSWKDDELQKAINTQNAERERLRQRIQKGTVESDESEEEKEEDEPEEKIIDAQNILKEFGDNTWVQDREKEKEVLENIENAIENVGKTFTEDGGIMNLPTISSDSMHPIGEATTDDAAPVNKMERELEEVTKSRKRRRNGSQSSDEEGNNETPPEKSMNVSTVESMTKRIASKQKQQDDQTAKKPAEKKAAVIDLENVLKGKKGGRSNAEVIETEDVDGVATTIREAFEDDDIIREFGKNKRQKIEEEKGKVVNLILPGWDGTWAGEDFKPTKRQKKRFRIKQKINPRADRNLGHVIISEQTKAVDKMRVERLPFPFQNPKQFEKSISQPIGNTWNTAGGFRDMIAPSIVTTPGQIIAPANMEKEKRFSDIFTINDEPEKVVKGVVPKRMKRGRRKTAADNLSLSNM